MKKSDKIKFSILISLAIIFAITLIISLYNALILYIPQQQEQHRFAELRQIATQNEDEESDIKDNVLDDELIKKYAEIKAINSDFRGWLKVSGTNIDYPVVKSSEDDPEYYLRRDFDKNYSFSGTPFICGGADENSDIFIIYGHKTKTDTMFGKLDKFDDEKWAKKHQDIVFDTTTEKRVYRAFAVFQTKVGVADEYRYYEKVGNFDDLSYNNIVSEFKGISKINIGNSPTEKAQILLLSTCSYHTQNGRFVVAAYRIK
jgi:sortase B